MKNTQDALATQKELAEMERHNFLLIWEENKALRAHVARLEDALKAILGWRELRDKIVFPVERVEDIARTALVGEEGK